jgi:hypothetical protein
MMALGVTLGEAARQALCRHSVTLLQMRLDLQQARFGR